MPVESPDYWTWSKFNSAVDGLCPLQVKRIFGQMNPSNVWCKNDGSSQYYRLQIRNAIIDLMNFIPEFTKNHETVYFPQDFVPDGHASVGALPPNAKVTSAWYYNFDQSCETRGHRFPVVSVPWEKRFELTTRETWDSLNNDYTVLTAASGAALGMAQMINSMKLGAKKHAGLMALSPQHERFYCHPQIRGQWVLSIFWDGQKFDYREQELVPFEEETAQAVADYVMSKFAKVVERDVAMSQSFDADYIKKRSLLFIRLQQKGWLK